MFEDPEGALVAYPNAGSRDEDGIGKAVSRAQKKKVENTRVLVIKITERLPWPDCEATPTPFRWLPQPLGLSTLRHFWGTCSINEVPESKW